MTPFDRGAFQIALILGEMLPGQPARGGVYDWSLRTGTPVASAVADGLIVARR
jgi:hypothetical protein